MASASGYNVPGSLRVDLVCMTCCSGSSGTVGLNTEPSGHISIQFLLFFCNFVGGRADEQRRELYAESDSISLYTFDEFFFRVHLLLVMVQWKTFLTT